VPEDRTFEVAACSHRQETPLRRWRTLTALGWRSARQPRSLSRSIRRSSPKENHDIATDYSPRRQKQEGRNLSGTAGARYLGAVPERARRV